MIADVRKPGLREQVERLGDRGDERQAVSLGGVDRLEAESHPRSRSGRRDSSQALDDDSACVGLAQVPCRAGQEQHGFRLVAGEANHAGAERLDPLLDVERAVDHGVRQDRRDERDAVCRPKTALAERRQVGLVVSELRLPDPDSVESGGGIGAQVVAEARTGGRDLAQRQRHQRPGSFESRRRGSGGRVSRFAAR